MSHNKKIGRHFPTLMHKLQEQRSQNSFCDVCVVVRDRKFFAHRCILAAASRRMHDELMTLKAGIKSFCLDKFLPEVFQIVLDFIYSSSHHIPRHQLINVLNAAKWLEIDELVQSCSSFAATLPNNDLVSCENISDRDGLQYDDLQDISRSLNRLFDQSSTNAENSQELKNVLHNSELPSSNRAVTYSHLKQKTCIDQDALSEISMQNELPEEDVIFKDKREPHRMEHRQTDKQIVSKTGDHPQAMYNIAGDISGIPQKESRHFIPGADVATNFHPDSATAQPALADPSHQQLHPIRRISEPHVFQPLLLYAERLSAYPPFQVDMEIY